MSYPHCVYINSRCRFQSVTQQYLKRCLIKFWPIAAIIRFSSKSMVVVLYRIGMVMSRWWDLNICDVCCMLLLRDMGGGGGSVMCAVLGCTAQVRLLAAVLCGSPAIVSPFRCLLLVGFCYGFCRENHNHTNPIKYYHHTFGWKPDDGHNRPKHVVTIILY